ncbi:protein LURP-one-related 8-like [Neltuma alba]|uniref:protein LURP-one-related 8-like n=1 Tax=Neltuma alba TaxID=207710 RepID=UPI0010A37096|nr:protein LURP-one-related 8-like [Prosopis alba]XP_028764572.1 protein LURP-one-related 8-like [Prosopis alba]
MTKVHPNAAAAATCSDHEKTSSIDGEVPVVLTVWKKSLLLNCNGFTVFDCQGNLVFRVDNYSARSKDEILLMDAAGTPLLTIRRKRLGLADKWLVFEGESGVKPRYSAKRQVNLLKAKCLAQVMSLSPPSSSGGESKYEIGGSYTQRRCEVYDEKRRRVAEIKKKEAAVGGVAFGADVFRLIVHPDMDSALAMAFIILLDQMFGSSSS